MQRKTPDINNCQPYTGKAITTKKPSATNTNLAVVLPKDEDCPFSELIEEWLEAAKAAGLSAKTIDDYAGKAGKFRWWWVVHQKQLPHPKHVTTKDARAFAAYLREPQTHRWGVVVRREKERQFSAASVLSYGRTVKVFFNWLEQEGYIDQSPFNRSVRFASTHKVDKTIKTVSPDSIARIFEYLEKQKDSYRGARNLAIIALLLDSGMRRGELLSIRLKDLDFKQNRCYISGKTGSRYALFSDECRRALVRYFHKFRNEQGTDPDSSFFLCEDGFPFSIEAFSSMIRRLEQGSGVRFHAHMFRHTFATTMAAQGVNVFDLKEMLGHSSINTTQIYVQSNIEHLQKIHRARSPLATLEETKPAQRRRGRPRCMKR